LIRELQTLLIVAEQGSFASAGERIGLTQGAVSLQMQRLEDHLGYPIFDRSGRSAVLNLAGRQVVEHASLLIDQWVALNQLGQSAVTLSMGCIASVQSRGLIPMLNQYRAQWSQTRVRVVPGVSLSLMAMVESRELDLAVMIRPPFTPPNELCWQTLIEEEFCLLAPSNATLPSEDPEHLLQSMPFIRYDRASFGGRQVDQFLQHHAIQVQDALELDDIDAVAEAVALGMGIAILPVRRQQPPKGTRLIPMADFSLPKREIGVLYSTRLMQQPAFKGLMDMINDGCWIY
jgi:DNA-binding transcriptional LysR family regulator